MIDVNGPLLSMPKAAELPVFQGRNGKPAGAYKMWRPRNVGFKSVTGGMVKLPAIKLPSGYYTSDEAVEWFFAKLNGQEAAEPTPSTKRTSAVDKAMATLAADNIR